MDESLHNPALYKWKRQIPKQKSRIYSRSQNCKTPNDIEDWIKKVEQASDRATEAVFGTSHFAGRERGKYAALQTREQVQEHDKVITEAQELLNNWMQDKLCLEDGDGDEADREAWHSGPVHADVKREWDHLLGNNDWELELTPGTRVTIPDRDPYAALDYSDEEEAVGVILSNMMQKPVVCDDFLQDLRLDGEKEKQDPRIKMELRHKQVKENREKREQELEKKRRERQEKKDSQHKAKQMVIKEERARDVEKRREEQEIRKEMARIRKEMQEERKQRQEQHDREVSVREEQERGAREELARQTEEERRQQLKRHRLEEEYRRRHFHKRERFQIKQSANNLKCLQQHFSVWYQIVLERRLQMGKARALADWKMLLRAWNAWRSYNRRQRLDAEAKQHEQTVVSMHRKQQQAEYYYRSTLLRRYLTAWQSYVRGEQDRRHLKTEQNSTRNKMMALLDAAATGKLWSPTEDRKEEGNTCNTHVLEQDLQQQAEYYYRSTLLRRYLTAWQSYVRGEQDRRHLKTEQNSTRNKMMALLDAAATGKLWSPTEDRKEEGNTCNTHVLEQDLDDFFDQPARIHSASKQNGRLSSKSDCSLSSNKSARSHTNRVPTEAWQVTREHVKLTNEEIASLSGGDLKDNAQHSDIKMRRRFGKQPWMNTHYVINNFENRYTSQQKILHDQQKQIKEQKRMIEELQFFQTQQRHQEDIARQQLIQKQLSKHGLSSFPTEENGTGLGAQQLNNLSNISHLQTPVVDQQRNNVSKEKDTNVAMETTRIDPCEQTTARSGVREQTGRTSSCTSTAKYLQVLKNMEDRAQERKRLKTEREAKRKKEEVERLVLLEAQEAEMRRQMEEEKKARSLAYKEKKRLEKQRETERNQQMVRLREQMALADGHYTRSVMKYRGIVPLQKLVQMSRQYEQQADQHYNRHILKQVVLAWHEHTALVVEEKNKLAEEMNSFLAVKRCFIRWKLVWFQCYTDNIACKKVNKHGLLDEYQSKGKCKYKHHLRIEMEKGRRHHERNLLHKVLQAWADAASEEKFASWERERVAKEHYLWSLKQRTFCAWRRLPEEIKMAAEREKRRNQMRKKVAHFLPDFEGYVKKSSELV